MPRKKRRRAPLPATASSKTPDDLHRDLRNSEWRSFLEDEIAAGAAEDILRPLFSLLRDDPVEAA
jgi:hypothetical protein